MRLLLPAALLAASLALSACSSSSDATTGSPGGDSGQSGAGGSATESDGGESGAPGSGGAASKTGYIGVVSRATEAATVFTNGVTAGFLDGPGASLPKGCSREVTGSCQVLLCDFTNGGAQGPAPGAPVSAGTVAIGGTTPTFSLEYDASTREYGSVPAVATDHLLFTGGSTVTFAAKGGQVPAFSESLVAPTPLVVTAPAIPGGVLSLDTGKDLVFDWTGSSAGMLAFNVRTVTQSATTTVSSTFVSCQFVASARTGTIPVVLLLKLRKTDATTTATLSTDLSTTKEVVAGDYAIHLAVGSGVTSADGKAPYAGQVTVH